MLTKALAGQSITIFVPGGSGIPFSLSSFHTLPNSTYEQPPPVSACHGAGDDPISPTCYPSCFFQWWNTVFAHPATELTNGALRRTNSGYLGYCNSHNLPDQTDLVINELDTEDEPCVSFFLSFRFSSVSSFLFCFFRFSSVFYVSLPFLPFLFRFFHTIRFLFASVRYRSVATALCPPYTRHSIITPQTTDFTTPTRVDAHEAHPARLLIYPLPWLRHGFTLFTSSIQL